MKEQTHVRLASAKLGDDATLTRYVRVGRSETVPRKHQPRMDFAAPTFVQEGRTKFPTRIIPVGDMNALLVSGHSNVKIGRDVRKGRLKGYWIYTLSFEERKTCPATCKHWQTCYGNNMPFAKRVDHTSPGLFERLDTEIEQLLAVRGREGVLIRLHALGDFFSVEYVEFWRDQLRKHPKLAIFGYTARTNDDPIGEAVIRLRHEQWDRFAIRSSDGARHDKATVSIGAAESRPSNAFICPEQTGQTQCCATCGACWSTPKTVAFLAH